MARDRFDAELVAKLRTVHVTRRGLLGAGAAAGLTIAGAHGVLASGGTGAASRLGRFQDQPKPGGTLSIATDTDPVGLDPQISSAYSTAVVTEHVYGSLMQYDKQLNEVSGDLAESVDISEDKLTYTFHLRQGVTWHDGQPFTSDDVKFSIERQKDPATGSPNAYMYAEVAAVTAVDPATVQVQFNKVQGPFLALMASPWASMVPKHVVEEKGDLQTVMVGTGPFKFVSYEPGKAVKLVKNPDYYVQGQPVVDELDIVYISDATSRLNAVLTKQVDLAQALHPKDYRQLSNTPGVQAIALDTGSCQWNYLGMNCTKPPFDNPKVRQAVAYAHNRRAIADNVYFGQAIPLTGGIIPQWSWAYAADLNLYPESPDVDKAKSLLAEAGYADGFETTIKVSPAYWQLSGEAAVDQEDLKAIGIDAKIINLEWGTFINDVFGKNDFDMQVCGWGGPFIEPDEFLYPEYHSKQGFNPHLFADPQVDQLLEQGRTTFDRDARKAIYNQVEQLIFTQAPTANSTNNRIIQAAQDYVKGFTPLPTGLMKWARETWLDK
ncbi:MAG TPA: ABC transporter substrate-binding protein [Thermomicrobiales bacterium]|jgi:peptide/nickel transport system substrate-binding protein